MYCPKTSSSVSLFFPNNYYSWARVPGYESIPSNNEWLKEGLYLERHCSFSSKRTLDLSADNVTGLTSFHQSVDSEF